MRLKRFFVTIHKWIGLAVGIQVVLWMLSGLVMAVIPIETVRSEHNIAHRPSWILKLNGLTVATVEDIADRYDAVSITVTTIGNDLLVFELKSQSGETTLVEGHSGALISPIPEWLARQVAIRDFAGNGKPVAAELITEVGGDYRGRLPAWRITFDDADNTRIYVAANDGRVSARRSDTWRLYDFFWMLHIMDYSNRENFNSPWMVGLAAGGLAVSLSGVILLWWSVLRPLVRRRRRA